MRLATLLNNKIFDRKREREHSVFIEIGLLVKALFDDDAASEDVLDEHSTIPSAPIASPARSPTRQSKKLQSRYSCPQVNSFQSLASQPSRSKESDESSRINAIHILDTVTETSDSTLRSNTDDEASIKGGTLDLDWLEDACASAPSSKSDSSDDALPILRKSECSQGD